MNAITQMLTGNNAISNALKRRERVQEIEQRLNELYEPKTDAQRAVSRHESTLARLKGDAAALDHRRISSHYASEIKSETDSANAELKAALAILNPILAEIDELEAEKDSLNNESMNVTPKDLQAAKKAVDDTRAQIERVERALAEMVIGDPSDLQAEHDALSAERDLLAADVALGESPQAELTAMEKQLTALGKKLAGAREAKRTAESTARGYAAKLERLKTDLVTAEEAFKELMGHWLTAERARVVAEINAATEKLGATYADLCALQSIARRTGATVGGRIPSELNLVAGRHEDLPPDFQHTRLAPGETSAQLAAQRLKKIGIQ
ncbi:hypothetical protein KQ940_11220 [Marinobacterium sp. D7]|uniref:hypothetical protein n=1 Tax=Marinobacterium ramblicola TaxID=2849041 RepID=UPI001C2CCFF5|nr:hypothetical protein [Marinobacterium ramblicola]MBV1788624.1 hypothetical protein [Marinobacterium ramblicola]